MATPKTTAPAVPVAPTIPPPAADTRAGTSADAGLLDLLTGDGTGEPLPPVADKQQEVLSMTQEALEARGIDTTNIPPATKPAPGSADFDVETATEAELDDHLRILEKKERIRQLTAGDQAAAPAPAAIAQASAPVPVTIVAATAPANFAAPSAPLIGKYDTATGLVQQLPQKMWDQLSAEDMKRFTEVPTQPEKPASLI